jgi:hypothetical protein
MPAPGAAPPRGPRGGRARLELQALKREHAAAQEEAERRRGVRGLLPAGRAQAAGAGGQQAAQLGEQRQQVVRAGQRAQLLRDDARRPRACARRQVGLRARARPWSVCLPPDATQAHTARARGERSGELVRARQLHS